MTASQLRRLVSALAILVVAALAAPALADECQYVHVIDPVSKRLEVALVGSDTVLHRFDLSDGGSHWLSDIDFSTLTGYASHLSFVSQGSFVRLIDHENGGVVRTVNVTVLTGYKDLRLTSLAAAEAVVPTGSPGEEAQYLLYAVGRAARGPVFVVLDQEALIENQPAPELLVAQGDLCDALGRCAEVVSRVAVGSPSRQAMEQVAYVSTYVHDESAQKPQRFFRINHGGFPDGPFRVSLDPLNTDVGGVGGAHRHLGLSFDGHETTAASVHQSERIVSDLATGRTSCDLGGEPTDVAIWGPGHKGEKRLQIVPLRLGSRAEVAVSPWLGCPLPGDPSSARIPLVGMRSGTSVALSSKAAPKFWAYVANGAEPFSALRFSVDAGSVELVQELAPEDRRCGEGTGTRLSIGAVDTIAGDCPSFETCPVNPDPPVPCCIDPGDPDPDCIDCSSLIGWPSLIFDILW